MLTASTIGLTVYGLHEVVTGAVALFTGSGLELWASAALIALGLLLLVSAAFVRVLLPGGLALAMGSLLALQALAIHNAVHFHPPAQPVALHIVRGVVAAALICAAYLGSRKAGERFER